MKSKTGNIQTDYSVRYNTYEKFNRVLYGGHDHDDQEGRFFTFAGDTPIFMGCASDYTKDTWCYQAKNGVLMSGMAMTPGYDGFAGFFHNCCDITAKWHHGYMSYEMTGFTAFFPDVKVKIEVYPLFPDDGFLVHYDITTDQRVIFCAGLGGITEFFGRFEYHDSARREFSKIDCVDNHARIDGKCGIISGPGDVKIFIGTDLDCEWSTDSADAMCEPHPGLFLNDHEGNAEVVKLKKVLEQNTHFCGNILVMKDSSCEKVAEYLSQLKSNAYPHALGEGDILLTADTVVILGDKILGKPHSETEAVEMISTLSGATHKVVTGVTLRTAERTISFSAESLVLFRELDAEEVSYYVEKYRPMDKAGAYGIQEWIGYIGIEGIEGSFYNVMGLPTQRLYQALKELICK